MLIHPRSQASISGGILAYIVLKAFEEGSLHNDDIHKCS